MVDVAELQEVDVAVKAARRRWSVDEYYRMGEVGLLTEDDRVELIDGEVIQMSPIGSRHAGCINQLNYLLNQQIGNRAIVAVQNPIRFSDNTEPQPDLALLRPRPDFYRTAHLAPADVLLVVEVADRSIGYDRGMKVRLYAEALIPEYWLVDLTTNRIFVFSEPKNGRYHLARIAQLGDTVASPTVHGLNLVVDDIVG